MAYNAIRLEEGKNTSAEPFSKFYSNILRQNPLQGMENEHFAMIYDAASKLGMGQEQLELACSIAGSIKTGKSIIERFPHAKPNTVLAASLFLSVKMEFERTKEADMLRTLSEVTSKFNARPEEVKGIAKFITKINPEIQSKAKHIDGIHYAKRNVFVAVCRIGKDEGLWKQLEEREIIRKARELLDIAKGKGFAFDEHALETATKAVVIVIEREGIKFSREAAYELCKKITPKQFEEHLADFRAFV